MEQLVARWAHNPKVVGSSPTPATKLFNMFTYLKQYLSKEGQAKAKLHWEANSILMSQHHEDQTAIANRKWKEQQTKDDLAAKKFVQKIINALNINNGK